MNDSKQATQTVDLAAWLIRIWDQQERLYKHIPDFIEENSARGPGWGKVGGDECDVCGAYQFSGYETVVEEAWYEHMEQVHQRRQVLARIAADRKILELHKPKSGECSTCCGEPYIEEYWNGEDETTSWERADLAWPCPTVRLLASPYKGREGWQEAWE